MKERDMETDKKTVRAKETERNGTEGEGKDDRRRYRVKSGKEERGQESKRVGGRKRAAGNSFVILPTLCPSQKTGI